VIEVLRRRPKQVLLAAGAMLASSIVGYISAVYILTYATQVLGLPQSTVLVVVTLAVLTWVPGVLFFAWLSDKVGRRKMFLAGAALLGLWVAYPFFWLIDTGSVALIFVSLVVGAAFQNMMYGPQAALFSEMFSTQVRYSGASLGYQLGILAGGALAPVIATSLYAATGGWLLISLYMAVACLITFACVMLITETYGRDITEAVQERGAV
jgi:MFS family permease